MPASHFILATAGHVDHGKSALVKALTGSDPDRLPEEKARGITIDLGFAHLRLACGEPQAAAYDLGIVDVPGHEDFVKNMVAGVGSIDLALLIVAADDGWMPQTEEHLQILDYLGVTQAVVALTKIDLAEAREATAIAALRENLRNSPFPHAPIVPTSIVTGRGLEELSKTLLQIVSGLVPPREIGKPRLPVDRVFSLRGIGTVITGTLSGGRLHRGQAVILQPGERPTRARGLQNHNQDVEVSGPSTRTAVNLPDVEPWSPSNTSGAARGDVLTLPGYGTANDTLDVILEKSGRLIGSQSPSARPLQHGAVVSFHHGSANHTARVLLLDGGELPPGGQTVAQLRFDTPVYAFAGDRFILRSCSGQATLAGGLILDPDARRRHWRTEKQRQFLQRRASAPSDPRAFLASLLDRDGVILLADLLVKTRFSAGEVATAVDQQISKKEACRVGAFLAATTRWQALLERAADAVDAAHREHPERPGLGLNDLRTMIGRDLPLPEAFDPLVAGLRGQGFEQAGVSIRRTTHRLTLPPHLEAAGARLRAALSAKPIDPPSRKELAPDPIAQQALRFLLDTGEAVEISANIVLSNDAFQHAIDAIRAYLRERGSATVSNLRQALGSSRRIMVPLLERLDRDGVTKRQGDLRVPGGRMTLSDQTTRQ